jgi:spore coat polysaccharide biosynthesis protein SpsF (cytidylyltransferase family)
MLGLGHECLFTYSLENLAKEDLLSSLLVALCNIIEDILQDTLASASINVFGMP